MSNHDRWPQVGDRVALACSCDGEIIVPLILMMPSSSVIRILARGERCRVGHIPRRRLIVRWMHQGGRRVFKAAGG